MRVYEYSINECVRGLVEARNKRAVKRMCKRMTQIYFPLRGIKTLEIKRVKDTEASLKVI